MKQFYFICSLLFLFIISCSVDSAVDQFTFDENKEEDIEFLFNYELLSYYYINAEKELDVAEFYWGEGEFRGYSSLFYAYPDVAYLYSRMSDGYTTYFDPQIAPMIYGQIFYTEETVDIGAQVEQVDSQFVVSQVYDGAPASLSGLAIGDTILAIDGTTPSSVSAFEKLTSGNIGATIILNVKRGEAILDITIKLATYMMPSVFLSYKDSIPVVNISGFYEETNNEMGTYGEFLDVLEKTENEDAFVIDLRQNGGGSLDQCLAVASEMLSENDTSIVVVEAYYDSLTWKGQMIDTLAWVNSEDGLAKDKYLVLLADTMSASCAEIMMVAMTTNLKTPVVGSVSYGKGIGQTVFFTYVDGLARITSMKIFDKDLKTYHKVGILPDFEIANKDEALSKAIALAKEKSFTRTAEYGTRDLGHFPDKVLRKKNAKNENEKGGAYQLKDKTKNKNLGRTQKVKAL